MTPGDRALAFWAAGADPSDSVEAAIARIEKLAGALVGPRVLHQNADDGALAIMLARRGFEVTAHFASEEARAAAAAIAQREAPEVRAARATAPEEARAAAEVLAKSEAPAVRARLVFALEQPDAPFDSLISFSTAIDPRAVRPGGAIIIAAEGTNTTPSAFAAALRSLPVTPRALTLAHGLLVFEAINSLAPGPAQTFDPANLLALSEALLAETKAAAERRTRSLEASQRALLHRLAHAPSKSELELRTARRRIADQRAAIERIFNTAIYRLGSAVLSLGRPNKKTATELPRELYRLYKGRRRLPRDEGTFVSEETAGKDTTARRRELDAELESFLARVQNYDRFVLMFSGTKYMQKIRANRPLRLTRVLLARGIPVYFNYHGSLADADRSNETHPLLFQAPVDYTTAIAPTLAGRSFGPQTQKIFIVSYPHRAVPRFLNRFNVQNWATLYDCRDDWEEFTKATDMGWYEKPVEKFVVNNCDVSFCVSRPLQAKIQTYTDTREVRLSPNAYDRHFLAPGWSAARTTTIKIGYFGHLTADWFDWKSLAEIARALPSYQFEIIGDGAQAGLTVPDNIRLLGAKEHREICALAREWHAAIIPFKVSRLADAVDPIKIYEYFALQLPVVSFRMPQIDDYPYTTTVETVADFVAALQRAVAVKTDPAVFAKFLAENTWEQRAEAMLAAAADPALTRRFEKSLSGEK